MDGVLQQINTLISAIINVLWGTHTFVVLIGVGLLLTIWSKFIQYRALTHGVEVVRGKFLLNRPPGKVADILPDDPNQAVTTPERFSELFREQFSGARFAAAKRLPRDPVMELFGPHP